VYDSQCRHLLKIDLYVIYFSELYTLCAFSVSEPSLKIAFTGTAKHICSAHPNFTH